jgi:hypothetical protein
MKQSGGFSLSGIFYGLLVSTGGPELFMIFVGLVVFSNLAKEDYTREQFLILFVHKVMQEPIPIIILLSSCLCLFWGSFIAANAAGQASGMAFVNAMMVGLVNFLRYLLEISECLVLPNGEIITEPYPWVGVIAIFPIALLAALYSVLTAKETRRTHPSSTDRYYSSYR